MNLQKLKAKINSGEIDTVIVAFPDVLGRLVGKRFTGRFFMQNVLDQSTHGCSYLLTVDIEMEPMEGFKLANWEKGFGDVEMRPDISTLRPIAWQAAAALVRCDLRQHNAKPVAEAPRTLLQGQVELLARKKLKCEIASELEFFLFNNTYHDAFSSGYRSLTPSSDYRIDYHTSQLAQEEP